MFPMSLLGFATLGAVVERFLLYDVIHHEQVNKQRRALMFYLDLAARLKRTLVLPRTRLVRRLDMPGSQFAPEAEYVSWGELYNVSVLARFHPVIELEQFVALHGPISLHVRIDHRACETGAGAITFNGLSTTAERTICSSGMQYNAVQLMGAEVGSLESLAFSESVDQLDMVRALTLRPYVRFAQDVYETAAAFVARSFGGRPFIALHWRRTDFLFVRASQPGMLQSASELIRHARRLMKRHGVEDVYLATDSNDAKELAVVHAALKPARYDSKPSTLRARVEMANVEITICAMAAYFLGTKSSSFTLAISEERTAIFQHAPETTAEMDALPSTQKEKAEAAGRGGAKKDEL